MGNSTKWWMQCDSLRMTCCNDGCSVLRLSRDPWARSVYLEIMNFLHCLGQSMYLWYQPLQFFRHVWRSGEAGCLVRQGMFCCLTYSVCPSLFRGLSLLRIPLPFSKFNFSSSTRVLKLAIIVCLCSACSYTSPYRTTKSKVMYAGLLRSMVSLCLYFERCTEPCTELVFLLSPFSSLSLPILPLTTH